MTGTVKTVKKVNFHAIFIQLTQLSKVKNFDST